METKERAEIISSVTTMRKFPYPETHFVGLRRHYANIGDLAMVRLLTHEMERHKRILKKLEFEKEMMNGRPKEEK